MFSVRSVVLILAAAAAARAQTTASCGFRLTIVNANAATMLNQVIAKLTNQSSPLRQSITLTNNASIVLFDAPMNNFFPVDNPRCPRYSDEFPQCSLATFENSSIPNECYPLVIGDRVFEDENENSQQNNLLRRGHVHPSGEPDTGYRNVTLFLYDQWGGLLDTTRTSNLGYYYFGLPGMYQLHYNTTYVVTIQYNATGNSMFDRFYTPTAAFNGSTAVDSNGVFSASPARVAATVTTPLPTGGYYQDFSIDFGFVCTNKYSVSGNAFIDAGNDGYYGSGDSLASGLTVFLYTYDDTAANVTAAGATKALLATTLTNALGVWSFTSTVVNFTANTAYAVAIDRAQYYGIDGMNIAAYSGSEVSTEESCLDNDARAYRGWASSGNASESAAIIRFQTTIHLCASFVCKSFGFFDCSAADISTALTYSGNSSVDFGALGTSYQGQWNMYIDSPSGLDPVTPDVGVPPVGFTGNVSGIDMRYLFIGYSSLLDRLYVAVTCFGICGDVDNDGDGGTTTNLNFTLTGGTDFANFSQSETASLVIDANLDGNWDYMFGIPYSLETYNASLPCPNRGDITCTLLYAISGLPTSNPNTAVIGRPLIPSNLPVSYYCNPSITCQDLQMYVDRFSTLPLLMFTDDETWNMNATFFMGSFEDDGIGEDSLPNRGRILSLKFPCPPFNVSTQPPFNTTTAPTPMPPTAAPTPLPTPPPGSPTMAPTKLPTPNPTFAGYATADPTRSPTVSPTRLPTNAPTQHPTVVPGSPSPAPTQQPTRQPTQMPTVPIESTDCCFEHDEGCSTPSVENCTCSIDSYCCDTHWDVDCIKISVDHCFLSCVYTTLSPTSAPTTSPTLSPTTSPTVSPTISPTRSPTLSPTRSPTTSPTRSPTTSPTQSPTFSPTQSPTTSPTRSVRFISLCVDSL